MRRTVPALLLLAGVGCAGDTTPGAGHDADPVSAPGLDLASAAAIAVPMPIPMTPQVPTSSRLRGLDMSMIDRAMDARPDLVTQVGPKRFVRSGAG